MSEDEKPKHSNWGIVLGKILELRKQKAGDTPYLLIKVDCDGPYGAVFAFCKIWKAAAKPFLKQFKKGDYVKLTGSIAQYEHRGVMKTNFNIFKFVPWNPRLDENNCHRAKFNVTGEVLSLKDGDDHGIVTLKIDLNSYIHELELLVPADKFFDVEEGAIQRFEGYLRQVAMLTRPVADEVRTV